MQAGPEVVEGKETGWVVAKLPPGFVKIGEGFRKLRSKRAQVAHLVFSDGLVAISVFVEPTGATPQPTGTLQQGGVNMYIRQFDDQVVTVLGEAPPATVRQIAYSLTRR
jgi:sigma-E factor negative regulatory protein RseB